MDKELKEKLEGLKSNGKKKGGCSSCKKKKEVVTELPPVLEEEKIYVPTTEEIVTAYVELGNRNIEPLKPFINKVYSSIFGESFDFGCSTCVNTQTRKFKNYITSVLKLNIL